MTQPFNYLPQVYFPENQITVFNTSISDLKFRVLNLHFKKLFIPLFDPIYFKPKIYPMKTSSVYTILIALFFLAFTQIQAQFVTPLSSISGPAEVITLDGTVITGKLRNASFGPKGIMAFKIIDKSGVGKKLKAAEVQQLKLKIDGLAKLEIIDEQTKNLEKLAHSNFKEVVEREYILWQRVKQPGKNKYLLLQLLNPGFDSKLKVYDLPNAKSGETSIGGVAVSGNNATAYYIVKDGKTYKISKSKYKKEGYKFLFGNCNLLNEEKPDFKEISVHVFLYDQACNN